MMAAREPAMLRQVDGSQKLEPQPLCLEANSLNPVMVQQRVANALRQLAQEDKQPTTEFRSRGSRLIQTWTLHDEGYPPVLVSREHCTAFSDGITVSIPRAQVEELHTRALALRAKREDLAEKAAKRANSREQKARLRQMVAAQSQRGAISQKRKAQPCDREPTFRDVAYNYVTHTLAASAGAASAGAASAGAASAGAASAGAASAGAASAWDDDLDLCSQADMFPPEGWWF